MYGDWYYLKDGRIAQQNCTPGEYLVRLSLVNYHFGDIWQLVGYTDAAQFVTQQLFITGDLPLQAEVDELLLEVGFRPVRQQFWLWKIEAVDGVETWLGNARADNFVRTEEGLVLIDLRMWNVVVGG